MSRTLDEMLELLADRCDPEDILRLTEVGIDQLLEKLEDVVGENYDVVNEFLDTFELEE